MLSSDLTFFLIFYFDFAGRHRMCACRMEAKGDGQTCRVFGGQTKLVDEREPEQRPCPSLPWRGRTVRPLVGLASHWSQRPHVGHRQGVRMSRKLHRAGKPLNQSGSNLNEI